MMRLLLSFLFGALTLLVDRTVIIVVNGADIVVNGANGERIVTVENVDLSEMTACDLQMRVFSAKNPVAARHLPHWVRDSNLSLTLGTVCVGIHDCRVPEEEEYRRVEQSRRAQGQIEIKRYQTVAEAFKLPRRRLLGKQAAGRLWRGPDRLVLTAVFTPKSDSSDSSDSSDHSSDSSDGAAPLHNTEPQEARDREVLALGMADDAPLMTLIHR